MHRLPHRTLPAALSPNFSSVQRLPHKSPAVITAYCNLFIVAVSEVVPEAAASPTFSNGVPCTALLGSLRREEVLERIGFLHLIR